MSGGHFELFENAQAWDFFGWCIPVMVLLICIEAVYSYAHDLDIYSFNDTFSSMSHGILTDLVFQRICVPALDLAIQCWIYYHYALFRIRVTWWLHLFTFFAIDLGYYWMHRAAHEINIFWATHQVHHSSERYNLSTATRQGLFQQLFDWVFYLPLAFFVPPSLFLVHKQFNTLYQFWIHTQMVGKMNRVVEFVFNTPSHHRAHHARNVKYLDKNYGGVLIIWDRMFGTFVEEDEPISYGLVQPNKFFDIFKSQFGHYLHITQRYLSYHAIYDRLNVLFCGPGWRPGTGRLGVAEEDASIRGLRGVPSYNPKIPLDLHSYVIFHALALGALILIIVPTIEERSSLDYALVIYCVLGAYQLSRIFQYGWGAFLPLELARNVLFIAVDSVCFVHNWFVMNRTHGIWWSPGISNFSYADHCLLIGIFLVHFFSILHIHRFWPEVYAAAVHRFNARLSVVRKTRHSSKTDSFELEMSCQYEESTFNSTLASCFEERSTPKSSPRTPTGKSSNSPRNAADTPKSPRGSKPKAR